MKNSTNQNHLICHDERIHRIDIIAHGFSIKPYYSDFFLPKLAPHYFPADCFGGSSYLAGTGSTFFSSGLFRRQLKFGGNWLNIIFRQIVLEEAQIWRELAPHYIPADCFGNLEGTGSTLFSSGLFWRQLKFGRNWLHIIFQQFVLEATQIWKELAPHYFETDCFRGSSNFEGTGSTLFSGGLFWKCGGNWLHIIIRRIVLEGSSDLAGTGSTIFSDRLFWRQLKFGGNWLHIIFQQIVLEAARVWRELAPHYFPADCFGGSSNLEGPGSTLFSNRLFWKFGGNWLHIIFRQIV
jgi:hypothetical protein